MKLHVLSDLHTEFENYELKTKDFDVLILAGDIGVGMKGVKYIESLQLEQPVLYLAGNHEYYKNALPHLTDKIRDYLREKKSNIQFLECRAIELGGVRFLGATLWTDYGALGNVMQSQMVAQLDMNDYKYIRISPAFHRATPAHLLTEHRKAISFIKGELMQPFDGKTVIITHHAPSTKSVYDATDSMTPCYASNLEYLMSDRVSLWIHGHTHLPVDYVVNGTRVLSNPKGYPDAAPRDFRPDLVVEI
jgi:predicted phosphodiesterase